MTRPVSLWENEQVEGYALCAEFILNDNRAKVDALRQRQAAFEATLPTDPEAIVDAALRLMHPNGATYPGKFEEALHMAKALRPMIRDLDTANPGPDRDALLWFAD